MALRQSISGGRLVRRYLRGASSSSAPPPMPVMPDDVTEIQWRGTASPIVNAMEWPWDRERDPVEIFSRRAGGKKAIEHLSILHGQEEGERLFREEWVPRLLALKERVRMEKPKPGYWRKSEEDLAEGAKEEATSREEDTTPKADMLVWVPVDEEGGYPLLLPSENGDFLVPCYQDRDDADPLMMSLEVDEMPLAQLSLGTVASMTEALPGGIRIALNHMAPRGEERILRAEDLRDKKVSATEGEKRQQAVESPPSPPDLTPELAEGEAEAAVLVEQMLSLLVCMRRSVRFAYLSAEVAGDVDAVVISVQTPDPNESPIPPVAVAGAEPPPPRRPRRRRRLPKLTGKALARFRIRHADRVLRQEPVRDIMDAPLPEEPLIVTLSNGWQTLRWRRKPPPPTFEEPLLGYSEVLQRIKQHPPVAHLVATQPVIFRRVFSPPPGEDAFFDSSVEYPWVEPEVGPEELERTRAQQKSQREAALVTLKMNARLDLHDTLKELRKRDDEYTGTTVPTEEEWAQFSERQRGELILGKECERDSMLYDDIAYVSARRRYALATQGIRAAAKWGPPGTLLGYKTAFPDSLALPQSLREKEYLFKSTPDTFVPGRGEMQQGLYKTRLEKRSWEQEVERSLVDAGAENVSHSLQPARKLAMSDPNLSETAKQYGPWNNEATKDVWHSWGHSWRLRRQERERREAEKQDWRHR
eukprot:Hpha_TRINITY_DN15918_c1_g11::TRINITY_DN15918_c1_g11_i1::g.72186::m.72186